MSSREEEIGCVEHKIVESRSFSVDPAIIKSIVREQSSSPAKAVAELIMNSVDAGATRIDVTVSGYDFVIVDDGRGFRNREEVVENFEIFGKPHTEGDAYFGRYRVGRGQIMAHAAVTWRSGYFEMAVDIESNAESLYTLTTHTNFQSGCVVSGRAHSDWFRRELLSNFDAKENDSEEVVIRRSHLAAIVRYIPTPVYFNGFLITRDPSEETWDMEDDFARYRFSSELSYLCVYDRGLQVNNIDSAKFFGRGGVVVSKQPLKLNMARNEVSANCDVWRAIRRAALEAFDLRLDNCKKKLNRQEARALIRNLLYGEYVLSGITLRKIWKTEFIEDVFGEKRTPEQMLTGNAFTLNLPGHSMVAERLQREKLAQPLSESLFYDVPGNNLTEDDCVWVVSKLREVFRIPGAWSWLSIDEYARRLVGTHEFLDEKSLSIEEELVLSCIRKFNPLLAKMAKVPERRILVGRADGLRGWTDGVSYIAIAKGMLQAIRSRGGEGVLFSLIVHEYCHGDPSHEKHAHDFEFYERFHMMMNRFDIHDLMDRLHGMYVAGVVKNQIRPSSAVRYHVDRMAIISKTLIPKIIRNM